jgi:hypothetical protein
MAYPRLWNNVHLMTSHATAVGADKPGSQMHWRLPGRAQTETDVQWWRTSRGSNSTEYANGMLQKHQPAHWGAALARYSSLLWITRHNISRGKENLGLPDHGVSDVLVAHRRQQACAAVSLPNPMPSFSFSDVGVRECFLSEYTTLSLATAAATLGAGAVPPQPSTPNSACVQLVAISAAMQAKFTAFESESCLQSKQT